MVVDTEVSVESDMVEQVKVLPAELAAPVAPYSERSRSEVPGNRIEVAARYLLRVQTALHRVVHQYKPSSLWIPHL